MSHVLPHALSQRLWSPIFPLPLGARIEGFYFTNHIFMTVVAAGVMMAIFIPIGRRYRARLAGMDLSPPKGFTGLIEGFMDAIRSTVVKPILGDATESFMPFLWTLFFFILICNLLGMVPLEPVFALLGIRHLGGTATGNINITGGLAICAFVMIHYSGIRKIHGQLLSGTFGHHAEHEGNDPSHGGRHESEGHSSANPPPHGEGHGHAMGAHDHEHHGGGISKGAALFFAPVYYLWNFAPHPFAPHDVRNPSPGLRVVMIAGIAILMAYLYKGLGILFAAQMVGTDAAGNIGFWLGLAFGALYGLVAGGLTPMDIVDSVTWGLLLPLEFIGALVKPFALCMRLFANMIAGHIVLASILLLIPVFQGLTGGYLALSLPIAAGCVLLSMLELFVAFLQAYIFMFLTTMFINMAVNPEH